MNKILTYLVSLCLVLVTGCTPQAEKAASTSGNSNLSSGSTDTAKTSSTQQSSPQTDSIQQGSEQAIIQQEGSVSQPVLSEKEQKVIAAQVELDNIKEATNTEVAYQIDATEVDLLLSEGLITEEEKQELLKLAN
jgi:hypothetical protein